MVLKWFLFWVSFAYAVDKYVLCTGNFQADLQVSETVNQRGVFCEYVFKNERLVTKKCRKFYLEDGLPDKDFNKRRKRSPSNTHRVCCLTSDSNRKCGASMCDRKTQTKIIKKFKVSFSQTEISTLCKSTSVTSFSPPFQRKLTRFFGKSPDLPALQKRFCQQKKVTQSVEFSETVTKTSLAKSKTYLLNNYKKYYSNPDYQKPCCKCSKNDAHSQSVNHYRQLLLNSLKQKGKEEQLICYYFNNGKYPESYQLITSELDKSRYWDNSNSYLNRLCSKRKHRPGFRGNGEFNYVEPNIELYAICHYAQTGRYFNDQPVAEIVQSRLWYKRDTFFRNKCGVERPFRPLEFWFGQENEFTESLRPTLPASLVKNSKKVGGYWVVHPKDWRTVNDYVYSGNYFKQRHPLKRANYPFGNPVLKNFTNYLVKTYQHFQSTANKPCCSCHKKVKRVHKNPVRTSYPTSHPSKVYPTQTYKKPTYSKKSYSKSVSLKRKVVKSKSYRSGTYLKTKEYSSSTSKSYSTTIRTPTTQRTRYPTTGTSYPVSSTHKPHNDVYLTVQLNKRLLKKLHELKRRIESLTSLVKGQSGQFDNLAKTVLSLLKSIKRPNELFKIKFSQNIQRPNSLNYNQLRSLVQNFETHLVEQLNNAVSKVVATIQQGFGHLQDKSSKKHISLETTCSTDGFLYE